MCTNILENQWVRRFNDCCTCASRNWTMPALYLWRLLQMRKSDWYNICNLALRAAYIRSIIGNHRAWFYVYEDTQKQKGPTIWRTLQMRDSVWNNACTVRWTTAADAQVGREQCLYCSFADCCRCADYKSDYKSPTPRGVSLHCLSTYWRAIDTTI
jgi:hypothetical protein